MVALPTAMIQTGTITKDLNNNFLILGFIPGLILTFVITLTVTYTSHVLGKSWVLLRERWPEQYTKMHCRKPYPEIGARALGPRVR